MVFIFRNAELAELVELVDRGGASGRGGGNGDYWAACDCPFDLQVVGGLLAVVGELLKRGITWSGGGD